MNLKCIMLSRRNKTPKSTDCESICVTCLPRAGPQARGWLQILTFCGDGIVCIDCAGNGGYMMVKAV